MSEREELVGAAVFGAAFVRFAGQEERKGPTTSFVSDAAAAKRARDLAQRAVAALRGIQDGG